MHAHAHGEAYILTGAKNCKIISMDKDGLPGRGQIQGVQHSKKEKIISALLHKK